MTEENYIDKYHSPMNSERIVLFLQMIEKSIDIEDVKRYLYEVKKWSALEVNNSSDLNKLIAYYKDPNNYVVSQ